MKHSLSLPVLLHAAPLIGDPTSGLTYSIPATLKALHRLDVPVALLSTALHAYTAPQPYPQTHIRDLPRRSPLAALPAPFNRPDLVILHSTYIPVHALLAQQCCREGIPYVLTPRGGMTHGAQQIKWLKKRLGNLVFFNRLVRHTAALHCLTENEAVDVREWGRPVFVISNGIELAPEASVAHPGSHRSLQFTFIGRLDVRHKGLDTLLHACVLCQRELRNAGAQVDLYGPDVSGSRADLERLCASHQIQDLFHVHPPAWGSEKQAILQNTDLFVQTSRFEGHPMGVLEALAHGIPCLLTPGTNMSAEVAAAGAGWEVAATPEAVAEGIKVVLSARTSLAWMGQEARSLVARQYTWNQVGAQLLRAYTTLLC